MKWIGLTGGLASGKSTVAEILRKKNIPVINADLLARLAVDPGTEGLRQVVSHFGNEILSSDGALDRKALAAKVFGQKSRLELLESIIHPIVKKLTKESREKLEKDGHAIAFYDVPLLFEKRMESSFDLVVVVVTSLENQMMRAVLRDRSNEEEVKSRLQYQIPLHEKAKRAHFIIENHGSVADLEVEVDKFLKKIQIQ